LASDGLHPAESFLDAFSDVLADGITGVAAELYVLETLSRAARRRGINMALRSRLKNEKPGRKAGF
jgi:hypothetical protein